MSNLSHIMPECYADTNLIEALMQASVSHQKGCNQVTRAMQRNFGNRFSVGIIDYDKKKPKYLNELEVLAQSQHLQLYKHPNRPHYIITIKPAIENFILACVEELGVNPKDYGVSTSLEGLKKQTKRVDSNTDPHLTALFRALQTSTEMTILGTTLKYLNKQQYCANIAVIKAIFAS